MDAQGRVSSGKPPARPTVRQMRSSDPDEADRRVSIAKGRSRSSDRSRASGPVEPRSRSRSVESTLRKEVIE